MSGGGRDKTMREAKVVSESLKVGTRNLSLLVFSKSPMIVCIIFLASVSIKLWMRWLKTTH